jgi:hypothetical protein
MLMLNLALALDSNGLAVVTRQAVLRKTALPREDANQLGKPLLPELLNFLSDADTSLAVGRIPARRADRSDSTPQRSFYREQHTVRQPH